VIVPAYNEEHTIGNVIEEIIQSMDSIGLPYEIIVVDDGSKDSTARIALTYKVSVLTNRTNKGKGYAVRRGFQEAKGDIIVTMDADGAHSPKEIHDLITPIFNGTDIVAGSRFLGTGTNSVTRLNRIGNIFFNMAIAALTGKRVTDSQTGFRVLKRRIIDKLNLASDGFDIETEITVKGLKNGFTFEEKPISCRQRMYGSSRLRILRDGTRILRTALKSSFAEIEH
jgi:glycosyltransferase involved in cell wall biosynthesis